MIRISSMLVVLLLIFFHLSHLKASVDILWVNPSLRKSMQEIGLLSKLAFE